MAEFSNSSGLKSVFEKLRFCDGLVWTVGLTLEIIKLRLQFLRLSVDEASVIQFCILFILIPCRRKNNYKKKSKNRNKTLFTCK